MEDLRELVKEKLRSTLHGKEIDTIEKGMPEISHMLGIVTLGAISTDEAIAGSILDHNHSFWDDYYKDINTEAGAFREVETAIRILRENDEFVVSTPYGKDAGIWYCEVEQEDSADFSVLETTCASCSSPVIADFSISEQYGQYAMKISIDCDNCEFEQTFRNILHKDG